MSPSRIPRALAVVLMAASFATAAPAHSTPQDPDSNDETFIHNLNYWAIPYGSEANAIRLAQTVCESRLSGTSITQILANLDANTGLSPKNVRMFYAAAARYYCPSILTY